MPKGSDQHDAKALYPRASGNLTNVADLDQLLLDLSRDYPDLEFIESAHFSWHAGKRHVSYQKMGKDTLHATWALLHELGHAILGHTDFKHDIELLQMEVAAWQRAHILASHYGLEINDDYTQDCLDTYRDWLHLRATCPTCFGRSLQASHIRYRCFNCQTEWRVSRSRLCRPYRLQTT